MLEPKGHWVGGHHRLLESGCDSTRWVGEQRGHWDAAETGATRILCQCRTSVHTKVVCVLRAFPHLFSGTPFSRCAHPLSVEFLIPS